MRTDEKYIVYFDCEQIISRRNKTQIFTKKHFITKSLFLGIVE